MVLFVGGLLAGLGMGWFIFDGGATREETSEERLTRVMAEFLPLTTSQTLLATAVPAGDVARSLKAAMPRVGLPEALDPLGQAGRRLMKVELYHFDNAPLVQLTYLDDQNGPVTLLITRREGPPAPPTADRRWDLNMVSWSVEGTALRLLSLAPQEVLMTLAAQTKLSSGR
jgi:hypothetical protein